MRVCLSNRCFTWNDKRIKGRKISQGWEMGMGMGDLIMDFILILKCLFDIEDRRTLAAAL